MELKAKVKRTISQYKLLDKKDRIVVALSGGKDSSSVLSVLYNLGYDVCGLFIDLCVGCWSDESLESVVGLCKTLGVSLKVFDLKKELNFDMNKIQRIAKNKKVSGCYICGVLKKWLINREAKKMGADKIVTGHNLDDEAETILINFLKGNVLLGFNSGAITGKRKGFVQRVKPLFFLLNNEIRKYAEEKGLTFVGEKCPYLRETYRLETREWLDKISDDEKLKIVEGWQGVIPKLRSQFSVNNKTKPTQLVPRSENNKNSSGLNTRPPKIVNRKLMQGSDRINICKRCGEPCRGVVCKACEVFGCLKDL